MSQHSHAAPAPFEVEFLTSNLSMPWSTMLGGSPEAYANHLEATGFDGVELTPVHSRFVSALVKASGKYPDFATFGPEDALPEPLSEEDEMLGQLVRSAHAPFRRDDEKPGLMARPFYPTTQGLGILAQAQVLSGDLPAVVYPRNGDDVTVYNDRNAPFRSRTVQPTTYDFKAWGITENSSIGDIEQAMQDHGVTGFTFDVFHCQTGDEIAFKNPVALAEKLAAAGLVEAIHLSVDRLDMTGFKPTKLARSTRAAGTAFATSALAASKTIEGEMMTVIADQWEALAKETPDGDQPAYRVVYEEGPFTHHSPYKQARIIGHARELMER